MEFTLKGKKFQKLFVRLLMRDDVEKLSEAIALLFSTTENRRAFLNSSTALCSAELKKTELKGQIKLHVTKPLLVAYFCAARNCCSFLLRLVDSQFLCQVTQMGCNVLHAMALGAAEGLGSVEQLEMMKNDIQATIPQSMEKLHSQACDLGLFPIELCAYLGQARLTELFMMSCPLLRPETKISGSHQQTTLDLRMYLTGNSRTRLLTSPVLQLGMHADNKRLQQFQEDGVLRNGGVLHTWIKDLNRRNLAVDVPFPLAITCLTILSIIAGNSYDVQYLTLVCNGHSVEEAMKMSKDLDKYNLVETVKVMKLIVCVVTQLTVVEFHIAIHFLRRCSNYRGSLCGLYWNTFRYGIPNAILLISTIIEFFILRFPVWYCKTVDSVGVFSLLTILVQIQLIIITAFAYQHLDIIGKFFANFFAVFPYFIIFFGLYLSLMTLFGQLLYSIASPPISCNISTSDTQNGIYISLLDNFSNASSSFYSIFRMSLNIIDWKRNDSLTAIILVHVVFVLFLPITIFNFLIGSISAKMSELRPIDHERFIFRQIIIATWAESILWPFTKMFFRLTGRIPEWKIVITTPCKIDKSQGEVAFEMLERLSIPNIESEMTADVLDPTPRPYDHKET